MAYMNTGTGLMWDPIYNPVVVTDPTTKKDTRVAMWTFLTDTCKSDALEKGLGKKVDTKNAWRLAASAVFLLQKSFSTTCFYAMYAFARWEQRVVTPRKLEITPKGWDFYTAVGYPDDLDNHNCIYNVFVALGNITTSKLNAENASKTTNAPDSRTYAASFIVYMAHIVALATAKEAKRSADAGNPVVYMFDIYAALLWCCRKIRERTMMSIDTILPETIFGLLSVEWQQDKIYNEDEMRANYWVRFVDKVNSTNDAIITGHKELGAHLKMPGVSPYSPFVSSATTTVPKQAQRIEFLFSYFFPYSVGVKGWPDGPNWVSDECAFTIPMSLAAFPLTPGEVNDKLKTATAMVAWDTSLDTFMLMAKNDLELFMGAPKPPPPGPTVCPKGEYLSKKTGKCTPIPDCPPTDDPKKTVFDEDTEMCVEPPGPPGPSSGGGGGGGGSGSGILLLLLLIGIAFIGSR
jgi:hypothetical protein